MEKVREPYETPVVTKVKFEDQSLVAFSICRKQAQIERDSVSCCNILPNGAFNLNNLDPS